VAILFKGGNGMQNTADRMMEEKLIVDLRVRPDGCDFCFSGR